MSSRFPLFCILLALVAASVPAADDPAPGLALAVPGSVGGAFFAAPSFLFSGDPRAAAYNPASAADRELPVFGASAAVVFPAGSGSGAGWQASAGASFPTALGNLYLIADGVSSPDSLSGYRAPAGFSGLVGLSKSASDDLSLGLSVGAASLFGDSSADGLFGAAGVELRLPDFASGGASLSLSLLGAGSRLAVRDSYAPVLTWTPLAAAAARLVDGRSFTLDASALIAFPEFADAVLSAGVAFGLGGAVSLDLGWLALLSETVLYASGDSDRAYSPRFVPSIALRIDGSSFLRFGEYGAAFGAGFRPVSGTASSLGASLALSRGAKDREAPKIAFDRTPGPAVSPRLIDSLTVPFSMADASPLSAWEATVYDETGEVVHRQGVNPASAERSGALSRLFSLRRGVKVPASVRIPLPKTLADGPYRLRLWARDQRGNEGRSPEYVFELDGRAPTADIAVEPFDGAAQGAGVVFTPNGDGLRDTLTVRQSGSAESLWIGRFRDESGRTVREYRWTDGVPTTFAWDGNDAQGARVGDGVYRYELSSADQAGNASVFTLGGLSVDALPATLSLGLDAATLSPDRDGSFETVRLNVDAPVKKGLIDWSIELVAASGAPFRAWTGNAARLHLLPESIVFDGRSVDGDVAPDGLYRFRAKLRYENGNAPTASSETLVVDTKKPEGRVRVSAQVFSIGSGDKLTFYHDLSRQAAWKGIVTDENGATVRTLPIARAGEGSVDWNGLSDSGEPVADGSYRYEAAGRSAAGIAGRTAPVKFRIESGGAAVALVADRGLFSPAVARQAVRFLTRLERRDRIVSYVFEIRPDSAGPSPVRRFSGLSVPPSSFVWDGLDETNRSVADGTYRAVLSVRYEAGGEASSAPVLVAADGTPPAASVKAAERLFSPNGDGVKDTLTFEQSAGRESAWFAEIVDEKGRPVLTREFPSPVPPVFVWDGRTDRGDAAPDGSYRYRLSATDAAGNEAVFESERVRLDARVPRAVLSADKFAFSPNGDGFADGVRLSLVPAFSDGLSSVAVKIVGENGAEARRLSDRALQAEYLWDGKRDDGAPAPDGVYRAVAELRYEKGDHLKAESAPVLLDKTAPAVSAQLAPLPFSPDDDGENDELRIALAAADASPLAGWSFSILDPEGYPFASFSGRELPAEPVVWDGSDPDGNLVEAAQEYPYVLLVRDQLGNVSRSEGKIPVDIFVLRDGDRLKIRVSSISFAPNAASLAVADPAVTERNRAVLDRIAAVLQKFPSYRIRVEGHAVNLSGTEREERSELEPLSLARAKTVLESLAERGVSRDRLEARGLGGREPVVPHGDVQARWRNRRVEFILVR